MLVPKDYGKACTSYGLGLLLNFVHKNWDGKDSFVFSPVSLIQSLELVRCMLDENTFLFHQITNMLRFKMEDSDTRLFLKCFLEGAQSERKLSCALWAHRPSTFSKNYPFKNFVESSESFSIKELRKSFSRINRWMDRRLPFTVKKIENSLSKHDFENSLVYSSTANLILNFDTKVFKTNKNSNGTVCELEMQTKIKRTKTKNQTNVIKMSLNNGDFYCLFVFNTKSKERQILISMQELCDPEKWKQIQKDIDAAKMEDVTFKIPPIFARTTLDLDEIKTGRFRLKNNSETPLLFKKENFKFNFKVVSSSVIYISTDLHGDEESGREGKEENERVELPSEFCLLLFHTKTDALVFAGVLRKDEMVKERESATKQDTKKYYRAGKSPPRGERDRKFDDGMLRKIDKMRGDNEDLSIIKRKLIPCPSYSETGGCTYGASCRFSHEIMAVFNK